MTEKMQVLSKYMHWRHVPPRLFMNIRGHLRFLWDTNKGFDEYEDDIKKQLPPVLKKELCYHVYGPVLRSAPFFSWLADIEICLKELSNLVETQILSSGDTLFRAGQPNEQIWLLVSGYVRLSLNESLFPPVEGGKDGDDLAELQQTTSSPDLNSPAVSKSSWAMTSLRNQVATSPKPAQRKGGGKPNTMTEELTKEKSIFKAAILEKAQRVLETDDFDNKQAALMVQRMWRERKARQRQKRRISHTTGKPQNKHRNMKTNVVSAPMYFGESCLWVPFKEWGDEKAEPLVYAYNVRCETRVELVHIHRDMVKEILARFDPWLPKRYDLFRKEVVAGLNGIAAAGSPAAASSTDTSMRGAQPFGGDPLLFGARRSVPDMAEQVLSGGTGELRQRLASIANRSRSIGERLGGVSGENAARASSSRWPSTARQSKGVSFSTNDPEEQVAASVAANYLAEPLLGVQPRGGRRNSTE